MDTNSKCEYRSVLWDEQNVEFVVHALVRAMIPHVRYDSSDEAAMAREASRNQSYEAKQVLSLMLKAGFFGTWASFVESAISEYESTQ